MPALHLVHLNKNWKTYKMLQGGLDQQYAVQGKDRNEVRSAGVQLTDKSLFIAALIRLLKFE